VDCAAAPCGKCFQSGLLKSAICPHDGLAASRQNASREEIWKKEKIFGKLSSDSHPQSSNGDGNFYLYTDF